MIKNSAVSPKSDTRPQKAGSPRLAEEYEVFNRQEEDRSGSELMREERSAPLGIYVL